MEHRDNTGGLQDMTDRQILYRLVGDVEALKKDAENSAKSREITRIKVESIDTTMNDMNRKLDGILRIGVDHEERLTDVEAGVSDYRANKAKIFATVFGVGIGTGGLAGGLGGKLGDLLSKIFGGPSG